MTVMKKKIGWKNWKKSWLFTLMAVLLLCVTGCGGNRAGDIAVSKSDVVSLSAGKAVSAADAVPGEECEFIQESNYESVFYIVVYKGSQSTVVYGKDAAGNYTQTVKVFTCSTGRKSYQTPAKLYTIRAKYRWRDLVGDVWGQYSTSFSEYFLFHSVPYTRTQNPSTLENDEYDLLGQPASQGCVRMCVRDCKWIYDNCPIGTQVNIVEESGPQGEPIPPRSTDKAYSGWDPTDEWSEGNPYFAPQSTTIPTK